MLLTDGSPNNTEDLRVYESAILERSERGDRSTWDVKLDLATEEIAEDVLDFLLDHAGANFPTSAAARGAERSEYRM